jgi:hypothetical protein
MEVSQVKRRTAARVGFESPPRLAKDDKAEEEALARYRRVRDEIRQCVGQPSQAISNVR